MRCSTSVEIADGVVLFRVLPGVEGVWVLKPKRLFVFQDGNRNGIKIHDEFPKRKELDLRVSMVYHRFIYETRSEIRCTWIEGRT